MNVLDEAKKLAEAAAKASREKAARERRNRDAHTEWQHHLEKMVDKHIKTVLEHGGFTWNGKRLECGKALVCEIEVLWTHYDHGFGEREEMDWSWRIHLCGTHTDNEEIFVEYLAKAVSKYLVG